MLCIIYDALMSDSVEPSPTHGLRIGPAPTTPSAAYLTSVNDTVARRAAAANLIESLHAGASTEVLAAIDAAVSDLADDAGSLAREVFDLAEEAFTEHRSVAAMAALLERHDTQTRTDIHGLPTAFVARLVDGQPAEPLSAADWDPSIDRVAILAEYDALPGIGHGCGHHLIGAGATLAFLALAKAGAALPPGSLPGEVVLLGTPAEEGGNGKEILAADGAFAGIDAAIMAHPFSHDSIDHPFIGRRILDLTFHGVPAHASATPFQGRNALDAVALTYQAVGLLRQHLYPGDRIHANITDGGQRPNIIPERASVQFYLRSELPETLRELSARVEDIADGIALATGTGVSIDWDPAPFTLPIRHNRTLGERWAVHQRTRGRTVYDSSVTPSHLAASTDFGNVSQRIPGIHPVIKVGPETVGLHTTEFAEATSDPDGWTALADIGAGLARVSADVLTDTNLLHAARAEFENAGGALDVEGFFS